ncbi:MAG: phage head closure protein [Vicinamibacterales bacterium]
MRRAGSRRHWIALQSGVDTKGPTGFTTAWTSYLETWASVEPITTSPTERPVANTAQVPATHRVELDYDDRVRATHRVLFNSRALHIVGPPQNVEERNKTLVLVCEERAA